MKTTLSQEDLKLLENLKDSKFYRERLFWIVDQNGHKVPFKQNPAQDKYYREKSQNDLILKARKLGFSSEIEGDFLHDCMFIQNTNAVTMAHTMDDTKVHMNRIQYYLETMGTAEFTFEVSLDTENERELYFPATNSYYWIGSAGAKRFGRGRDISRLHGSEVAHWQDQAVLTAVLDARRRGQDAARTILETTANGMGEKFCELWNEADEPNSGSPWKQHFFAWWMDPLNTMQLPAQHFVPNGEEVRIAHMVKQIYGIELKNEQLFWWRRQRAGMADKSLMGQEHPSYPREAFISSGGHFLNHEILAEYVSRVTKPEWTGALMDDGDTVSFSLNPEGQTQIWKMPKDSEMFLISADVAEGVPGGAWSVAKVFNRANWECVAQWRGRVDPGQFGKIMCDMGYFWNNAVLIPELNNHGWATTERIRMEEYPHLLNTREIWPENGTNAGVTAKQGFPTNDRTRTLIFSALSNAIDQRTYIEHDLTTLREMQKLVKDERGKVVVQAGFMDTTIAAAIGLYCLKFMTVDETYRENNQRRTAIAVTSLVSRPRGKTGYR